MLFRSRPLLPILHVLVFAGLATALRAAQPDLSFGPGDDLSGLKTGGGAAGLVATTNGLEITLTGEDPQLVSPPLSFPTGRNLHLKLRVRSGTAGEFQVFPYREHASEGASVRFQVPAFRWVDACIPLPVDGDGWHLRLDPPGTNGTCAVKRLWVEETGTVGITRVIADGTRLVLQVEGVTGEAEIVSLQPGWDLTEAVC